MKKYFFASLFLHSLVLITIVLPKGSLGDSPFTNHNPSGTLRTIVPKAIEVSVIDTPKKIEGDVPVPETKKDTKGLKECVGDSWYGGIGYGIGYGYGSGNGYGYGYGSGFGSGLINTKVLITIPNHIEVHDE